MRLLTSLRASSTYQSHKLPKRVLSLNRFLLRTRVLNLYRTILRSSRQNLPDLKTRTEMRSFARIEIERYKDVETETEIRYLVGKGEKEWDRFLGTIGGRVR